LVHLDKKLTFWLGAINNNWLAQQGGEKKEFFSEMRWILFVAFFSKVRYQTVIEAFVVEIGPE